MKRIARLLLVASLCACDPGIEPATQVIVVVGGDPRIEALEIRVRSENALQFVEDRSLTLEMRGENADGRRLPTSFTLVPSPRDPAPRFRLEVVGLKGFAGGRVPFVRSIVTGPFAPGQTTLLPMALVSACADEGCGCDWEERTCSQTCEPPAPGVVARCAAIPSYAKLVEVEPGLELEALQQGLGGCSTQERPGPSGECVDLDECAFGLDDCDRDPQACVNEVSGKYGFACHCPPGTRGEGVGPDGCR